MFHKQAQVDISALTLLTNRGRVQALRSWESSSLSHVLGSLCHIVCGIVGGASVFSGRFLKR